MNMSTQSVAHQPVSPQSAHISRFDGAAHKRLGQEFAEVSPWLNSIRFRTTKAEVAVGFHFASDRAS
jgi:hypothetical protein